MISEAEYKHALYVIEQYKTQEHKKKWNVPKYAKLGDGASLRHIPEKQVYYRDNGVWEVKYEMIDGKLISVSDMKSLNGTELIEITYEEWKEENN